MFRITKAFENQATAIYKVEGKVQDDLVEIWDRELNELLQTDREIILDLGQVWFLCQKGIETLLKKKSRHLYLLNCSIDVRNTLHAAGSGPRVLG